MKSHNVISVILISSVFMYLLLGARITFGIENRIPIKANIGTWLVVVGNDVKTRTLTIKSINADKEGIFIADSEYGFNGGKQHQIKVKLWNEKGKLNLSFNTPANNSVLALENDDGSFTGTFRNENGKTKTVSIKRPSKSLDDSRFLIAPHSKISIVYFKSYGCIYCNQWESFEKEKFINMKEYSQINFSTVIRENSEREQLPDDLKWLVDKHETGRGSPYFIVLVNQTIVLKSFGKDNWNKKVIPLLESLFEQKKAAS